MVWAIVCFEAWSSDAARRRISSAESGGRVDRDRPRPPVGSVPVLSMTSDGYARQRLQRLAALDQDALSAPRVTARRRWPPARRGSVDTASPRPEPPPRGSDRGEQPGAAGDRHVRPRNQWRSGRRAATSAPSTAAPARPAGRCRRRCSRQRAVARQVEGIADIGRAAHHRLAGVSDGHATHRSARTGRAPRRLRHRAVDRHDVALADQQAVARRNRLEGTSSSPPSRCRIAVRGTRSSSAVISRRARRSARARGTGRPSTSARPRRRPAPGRRRVRRSSTARRRCRGRRRRGASW